MGVTAFTNLFPKFELRAMRGRPLWLERIPPFPPFPSPITVWPTYHPAAALGGRSPILRFKIEDDLIKFRQWSTSNSPFPSACAKCGEEVEKFDQWGVAWCASHAGEQMELSL